MSSVISDRRDPSIVRMVQTLAAHLVKKTPFHGKAGLANPAHKMAVLYPEKVNGLRYS